MQSIPPWGKLKAVRRSDTMRGFLACLCLALVLWGAVTPSISGLFFAILLPVALLAIVLLSSGLAWPEKDPEAQPLGYLSLSLSRAPPSF
jgi:hypothetical protein